MEASSPSFRVRQVGTRLQVPDGRVLHWIHSGKLPALNVAAGTGKKARWRVRAEDLALFEETLLNRPIPKRGPRRAASGWKFKFF